MSRGFQFLPLVVYFIAVLQPIQVAVSSNPTYDCGQLKTYDSCIFSTYDPQCKMVEHHGKCQCVPDGGALSHFPNCLGDEPKNDSSDSTRDQVLVAILVGFTLLVCVCCVCLVFLQPFSTNAKMTVETQPLMNAPSLPLENSYQYQSSFMQNPGYHNFQPSYPPSSDPSAFYPAQVPSYPAAPNQGAPYIPQ